MSPTPRSRSRSGSRTSRLLALALAIALLIAAAVTGRWLPASLVVALMALVELLDRLDPGPLGDPAARRPDWAPVDSERK